MKRRRPPSLWCRTQDAWNGIRDLVDAMTDPYYHFRAYRPHRRSK